MPLETASYIHQLNAANPLGSDPIAAGDDHIRLIKSTLKDTFPGLTGPVTVGQAVLNNPFPIGGIILWSGSIASVPSGWALCNGSNGTPDLRDRFVVGAGSTYAVDATGGANTVTLNSTQIPSHTHTATTDSQGSHTHAISDPSHAHSYVNHGDIGVQSGGNMTPVQYGLTPFLSSTSAAVTGIGILAAGAHTHNISVGSTGGGLAHENRPPYYALAYIMKV